MNVYFSPNGECIIAKNYLEEALIKLTFDFETRICKYLVDRSREMRDVCNIIAKIVEKYVELFQAEDTFFDNSLTDLGMESMDFVYIIVEIEEKFEIEIPDEMLFRGELDSIHQLAEVVTRFIGVNKEIKNEYN